ncbi:hypothetical protein BCV52_26135 [Priestia aryabhattai]|nr:hypothetical protein BCV52_26135 [Priestia aryabhattai]
MYAIFGNQAFERFKEYVHKEKINFYNLKPEVVSNWVSTLSSKIRDRINFLMKTDPHFTLIRFHNFLIMYEYWARDGKHFHLDTDLANMLVQTDVHKVKSFLVKLPFSSAYFTVPYDLVQLELTDDEGEVSHTCYAQGAYVSEIKDEKGTDYLRINTVMRIRNEKKPAKQEGEAAINLLLPINNNEDIFNILNKQLDERFPLTPTKDVNNYNFAKNNRVIAERYLLLIVNSLLYLQSDKAILEQINIKKNKVNAKKSKKKHNKNNSKKTYLYIGEKVTINQAYKKVYEKLNNLENEGSGVKQYKGQWIVRGHWRNQPYGEALSQRKLIWIEPYVKGSGKITEKQYNIK